MKIIPRSEWGARYADSYRSYTASLPKRWGYLHHPVTSTAGRNATLAEDIELIRLIEQIGQNRFGWGISYSFCITQAGRIFQGHRTTGVGTHTHGYNSSTLAICFVGNYDEHTPTEEQINAAAWLMRHGHEQGWTTDYQLDGGHRDLKPTSCPGQQAYDLIPEINRRAREDDIMPSAQEIAKATVDEFFDRDVFELPFDNPSNQYLRFKWFMQFLGRNAWHAKRGVNALPALIEASHHTPDEFASAMRPHLKEVVGPVVEESVRSALGADNAELADAIIDELNRRLTKEATS